MSMTTWIAIAVLGWVVVSVVVSLLVGGMIRAADSRRILAPQAVSRVRELRPHGAARAVVEAQQLRRAS